MDIPKLINSFKFALNGIFMALKDGQNMKIHFVMSGVGILLALVLKISRIEFLFIISVIFLVIILEAVNTAVEKLVDEVSTERRPELGAIKDIMAGAVLLAAILSIVYGLFIFVPRLLKLF